MITKAQSIIIKDICDIELKMINEIIQAPALLPETEEVMQELSITRVEFNQGLVKLKDKFEFIKKNPEQIYNLSPEESLIVATLLSIVGHKYKERLPNAYINLVNKLLILDGYSGNNLN